MTLENLSVMYAQFTVEGAQIQYPGYPQQTPDKPEEPKTLNAGNVYRASLARYPRDHYTMYHLNDPYWTEPSDSEARVPQH